MTVIAGIEVHVSEPSGDRENSNDPQYTETIICLHGIGGDHNGFIPQHEALSNQYRVISWNMPGYRRSQPLASLTFETLASAVIRLMDALQIDSAHIIGQSIGGMIAQELAISFPQRVRSLILIATTSAFGGKDEKFKQQFLAARLAPIEKGESMESLAKRFIPEIVGSRATRSTLTSAESSMAAVPVNSYKQVMECLITFNRRNDLNHIKCPVCLIAGEQDNNAPAATMQKMASKIAAAEFHCIDGAGHLTNLECPVPCNEIIKKFLTTSQTT